MSLQQWGCGQMDTPDTPDVITGAVLSPFLTDRRLRIPKIYTDYNSSQESS